MSRSVAWLSSLFLLGALAPAPLWAVSTQQVVHRTPEAFGKGELDHIVVSEQGQPLATANVFITEMNVSTPTNDQGVFRITLPAEYQDRQPVKDLVERLMGKNPEHRFNFIQNNAANLSEDEIDA